MKKIAKIPDLVATVKDALFEAILTGDLRPGEKLHEVLCLPDTAWQTVEYDNHYVIKPSFKFNRIDVDYLTAANGEKGKLVEGDFSYDSYHNDDYLSVDELRKLIESAMPFTA